MRAIDRRIVVGVSRMLMLLAVLAAQSMDSPIAMPGQPNLDVMGHIPGFPAAAFLASPNKKLRLDVTVGPDGQAKRCEVVESSGTASVDKKACALIKSAMRFPPPLGPDGKLAYGRFEGTISNPDTTPTFAALVGINDYPAEALRKGESGTVAYDAEVDATGKAVACTIVESSGSKSLDRTTCDIVRKRARYAPAESGTRHEKGRVSWNLPR